MVSLQPPKDRRHQSTPSHQASLPPLPPESTTAYTRPLCRSATQPPTLSRRNPPARAVPTCASPSRTPARRRRRSTAGSYSARWPTSTMWLRRRRPCPWGGTLGAQEERARVCISTIPGSCVEQLVWVRRRWKDKCQRFCVGFSQGCQPLGNRPPFLHLLDLGKGSCSWQTPSHRQTIRRLPRPLAPKVRHIPALAPQERRSKRRHQGPGHRQPDRQAHPSQPSAQAASSHVPCAWSCMSYPFPSPFLAWVSLWVGDSWFGGTRSTPTCPTPATSSWSSPKARKSCRRARRRWRARRRGWIPARGARLRGGRLRRGSRRASEGCAGHGE